MNERELAYQVERAERIRRSCTPYQYGVLCKAAAAVDAVLFRERATLAYFADDNNDEFFARIKRALLDGMAAGSEPQRQTGEPQHLDPVGVDPDEYRPTYWWQD